MKNKTIMIAFVILLIIILVVTVIVSKQEKEEEQQVQKEQIEEIKNETGATADTNIYEVGIEYDGREVLQVKPEVQAQTVWAGIEKNASPTDEETNTLWSSKPTEPGIWVSPDSRDAFLTILQDNGLSGRMARRELKVTYYIIMNRIIIGANYGTESKSS